jgi:hypothetical protein
MLRSSEAIMKMLVRFGCAAILLLMTTGDSLGQWVQVGPPGFLTSVLKTTSSIMVGSAGAGIYYSTDNGATWLDRNTGLMNLNVTGLSSAGQNIYASTRGGGVYLSSDNGASWTPVNSWLISLDVGCVGAFDTKVFAGPVGYGAFCSSDNGATWLPAGKGMATDTVTLFYSTSSRIFAGTTRGLCISTDGGKTWAKSASGLPPGADVRGFASIANRLFVGFRHGGVYTSNDGGAIWSAVNNGLLHVDVTCLAATSDASPTLVVGTATGGIYTSVDSGASWTATTLGLSSNAVSALATGGSSVYAALGEGVRVSSDAGMHWASTGTALPVSKVTCLGLIGTSLLAGANHSGVYLSTDRGDNWVAFNQQLSNTEVTCMAISQSMAYVGTTGGSVFHRSVGDSAWTNGGNAFQNLSISALGVAGSIIVTGPAARGIFYSSDDGSNWTLADGSVVDVRGTQFLSFASWSSYIFGGSLNYGIFRSADYARSWVRKNNGLGNLTVRSLAVSGSRLFAGTSGGLFVSTDNGESWVSSGTSLAGSSVVSLATSGNMIFASTSELGVGVSTNQGLTWQFVNEGLPGTVTATVFCDGEYAYLASTLGGVYRRSLTELLSTLDVHSPSPVSALEFALLQNYPNPFNPKTVVSCQWPVASRVKLVLYDMLGREVATLLDGQKEPGTYEVTFDGTGLASGVYLCRLQAGDFVTVRKLVLMK